MKALSLALSAALLGTAVLAGLPGCANEPVPDTAQLNAAGTGQLTWVAPRAGRIIVYDNSNKEREYVGNVLANQTVKVDPTNSQIRVDNEIVVHKPLGGLDDYRIYYEHPTSTASEYY